MGTLLDTSVLIALEHRLGRADPEGAGEVLGRLFPADDEIGMAAITASELLHGVHRASPEWRARREAYVESVLHAFVPQPFDARVARVHARLWADLEQRRQPVGPHDLMIAATALALGWSLASLNRREFERVASLRVVAPAL